MSTKSGRSSVPRRGNLASRAADQVRSAILRGEYAVGERLRERELCRTLGISRIPLREALHRLEGEGIVTIRPNRGAMVAGLSKDELDEIAETCRLLESNILRRAVPVLTDEKLDKAEECLARLDGTDDPVEWTRLNWVFHTTLYAAARRPLQIELLTGLRARADRVTQLLVADKKRRLRLNREHRAILASARGRQAIRASAQLDAHLKGAKEEVLDLLDTV